MTEHLSSRAKLNAMQLPCIATLFHGVLPKYQRIAMTAPHDDLLLIATKTLEHYNERAVEFWEGTRDHDVKQNIEALLRHIRGESPLRILDFGCGPGRDLAAFHTLGHEAIGLEGSPPLAAMARTHSG